MTLQHGSCAVPARQDSTFTLKLLFTPYNDIAMFPSSSLIESSQMV